MLNLEEARPRYRFRVQGGEPRGGCLAALLSLGITTIAVLGALVLASVTALPGLALMGLAFGISIAGFMILLRLNRAGTWAPWILELDTDARTLRCLHRRGGEETWRVHAEPDHFYLSRLKLREGDAGKPLMALVHGTTPHTPVEDTTPTPEHTVLGAGDQATLYALAKRLQEELDASAARSAD